MDKGIRGQWLPAAYANLSFRRRTYAIRENAIKKNYFLILIASILFAHGRFLGQRRNTYRKLLVYWILNVYSKGFSLIWNKFLMLFLSTSNKMTTFIYGPYHKWRICYCYLHGIRNFLERNFSVSIQTLNYVLIKRGSLILKCSKLV